MRRSAKLRLILAPFLILFGYGVAVAVATTVTLAVLLALALMFDADGGGLAEFWRDLPMMFSGGFTMTFIYALPGFLLVLVLAWRLGWSRWPIFAVAGSADAVVALLLASLHGGGIGGMLAPGMMLSCVFGGFAGGACYWTSAVRFLHFPKLAASN